MKLKDKLVAHCMGDEILIINADDAVNQGIIRGNASVAAIVQLLQDEDITEDEMVDRLTAEYDAPKEIIADDVHSVIEKLNAVGALDGVSLENANARDSSFEEQLAEHGKLMYHINGDSMLPLLRQGRDVAVITAKTPNERCKLFDVVLYKRDSGQYVLHRIVKVKKNGYVICGDNRYYCEKGITDRHIIGVLGGVVRDGVYESACSQEYMGYIKKRCRALGLKCLKERIVGRSTK